MARPDAALEASLARFAAEVQAALGPALTCLALHGSAARGDWVATRSDVNTVLVVTRVTLAVLDALAPVVGRWRPRRFAPPLVMDDEYLARARDVFPMELDDMRAAHRVLAGRDVLAALALGRAALRRECEREARGKLLRLRALYLEAAGGRERLAALMLDSLKSFLVILRHLLGLRGVEVGVGFAAVLERGEQVLGPLPTMRRLLAHRDGSAARPAPGEFGAYLAEIERIVAAVDALDG